MVRLPRCHGKLGAKLGRSDCFAKGPGNQPQGSDLKRASNKRVAFAPGLSFGFVKGLTSHSKVFSISNC